jgi:VanZ family protein
MNRRVGLALGWAWAAGIVFLSLTPSPPQSGLEGGDKLAHFLAYAVLTYWFSQFYFHSTRLAYALGFAVMGIGLEFAQGGSGYRSFELADMAANALGVLAGLAAARLVRLSLPPA